MTRRAILDYVKGLPLTQYLAALRLFAYRGLDKTCPQDRGTASTILQSSWRPRGTKGQKVMAQRLTKSEIRQQIFTLDQTVKVHTRNRRQSKIKSTTSPWHMVTFYPNLPAEFLHNPPYNR